jgi:hypothetical protein
VRVGCVLVDPLPRVIFVAKLVVGVFAQHSAAGENLSCLFGSGPLAFRRHGNVWVTFGRSLQRYKTADVGTRPSASLFLGAETRVKATGAWVHRQRHKRRALTTITGTSHNLRHRQVRNTTPQSRASRARKVGTDAIVTFIALLFRARKCICSLTHLGLTARSSRPIYPVRGKLPEARRPCPKLQPIHPFMRPSEGPFRRLGSSDR